MSVSIANEIPHQLFEGPCISQARDENIAVRDQESITSDTGSCRRARRHVVKPYARQAPVNIQPAKTTATSHLLPRLRLDNLKTTPLPPTKLTIVAATRRRSPRSAWYVTRPSSAAE